MDDIQFLITYPPTQRSDTIYGSPLIMSFCLKYARLFISYSCFINIIWKIKVMNDRFRIHNENIWLYFDLFIAKKTCMQFWTNMNWLFHSESSQESLWILHKDGLHYSCPTVFIWNGKHRLRIDDKKIDSNLCWENSENRISLSTYNC